MPNTRRNPEQMPRVTVERALWILIAVIALTLRLTHLDAAPLNEREAYAATLSWRAATGLAMHPSGCGADCSPLLFAANTLLFTLCGTSDAIARLWSAVLGGALALTPLMLRRRLGRVGALAAGVCLTISPTALFTSRQLDGATAAAVGGMMLLGGLTLFSNTRVRLWLTLSAGGLALAVTSSPSAYGLLLPLGLSWLILSQSQSDIDLSHLRPHISYFVTVFLLAALAFSTGLGWNLAGLEATVTLPLAWIADLRQTSNFLPSPITLLIVYEPLILLFGIGGLTWAVWRNERFSLMLGLWAGLGVFSLSLAPGWRPSDVLMILLPLAMLSGLAIGKLIQSLQKRGEWVSEGLHIPVVLILWTHAYLTLAHYAKFGKPTDLFLTLLVITLQLLLGLIFALTIRPIAALRSSAVGTGAVLLAFTLSIGWRVTHLRPADPRELLVRAPTALEVHDLAQTLREISWRETGMPTTLPFTLEAAPDSVLAWYLRDFSAARRVDALAGKGVGATLVTPRRDITSIARAKSGEYVGQDFALRRSWDPAEVRCLWGRPPRCDAAAGWLLFRHTPSPPMMDQQVVLWRNE